MSRSAIRYQKPVASCTYVLASLLKRLDMRALAVIMFVALALLSSTRGKELETRSPASPKATTSRVILDKFVHSPQKPTLPPGVRATSNQLDRPGHFQNEH